MYYLGAESLTVHSRDSARTFGRGQAGDARDLTQRVVSAEPMSSVDLSTRWTTSVGNPERSR